MQVASACPQIKPVEVCLLITTTVLPSLTYPYRFPTGVFCDKLVTNVVSNLVINLVGPLLPYFHGRQLDPGPWGPTVRGPIGHFLGADSWALDNWALEPNCPGPNLSLF